MSNHARIVVCITLLVAFSLSFGDDTRIPLSFDQPFFVSSYKKVLDTSMHVWEYLETLHDQKLAWHERVVVQDAVVGRVIGLRSVADQFLHEYSQGKRLVSDDVNYLLTVLGIVEQLYGGAMSSSEHATVGGDLLRGVKSKLEQALQAH